MEEESGSEEPESPQNEAKTVLQSLGERNHSDTIRNHCFKNHRNSRIYKQDLELFLQREGQVPGGWRGPCEGTASLMKGEGKHTESKFIEDVFIDA